jgi:hypothetical protein
VLPVTMYEGCQCIDLSVIDMLRYHCSLSSHHWTTAFSSVSRITGSLRSTNALVSHEGRLIDIGVDAFKDELDVEHVVSRPLSLRISVSGPSAGLLSVLINHDKRLIGDTLGSLEDECAGRPGAPKARSLANTSSRVRVHHKIA